MPLSDEETYERLHAALIALGGETGLTIRSATALEVARQTLTILQMSLLAAMEKNADKLEGVLPEPRL
jgi:hypothetical protein